MQQPAVDALAFLLDEAFEGSAIDDSNESQVLRIELDGPVSVAAVERLRSMSTGGRLSWDPLAASAVVCLPDVTNWPPSD